MLRGSEGYLRMACSVCAPAFMCSVAARRLLGSKKSAFFGSFPSVVTYSDQDPGQACPGLL